ncbi:Tolloid-like protein 2 [Portunus trituberculatus]|uniref:Tolloid-like protein 2 n=1 Tax=Portunus trituberculatus TaxID=210409 RepID=A0A5B7GKI2_PORTR|nr:Tolloid-like protein 2 [Portunus trituberculatus]
MASDDAPLHEKIRLEFHDFDVTGSADCHGDYLSISSRPSWTSSRESGDEEETEEKYCGTQGPGVLTSTGDTLVVTFASNAKGSCRGFNASYSVKEGQLVIKHDTKKLGQPDHLEAIGAHRELGRGHCR